MLLTQIFCVSEEDEAQLLAIAPSLKIEALGDTRYDQVIERLNHPKPLHQHLKPFNKPPTLVAGSTWAEDEKVLAKAITPLLKDHRLNLVIAPHEPSSEHLTKLTRLLNGYRLPWHLYSEATSFIPGTVLIIDQVGILAELYQWGHLAFVGGSFRGSVHSVMEPIAAGCLTAVGPYHLNNREAVELKEVQTLEGHRLVSALRDQSDLRLWLTSLIDLQPEQWQAIRRDLTTQVDRRSGATLRLFNKIQDYF